MIAAGAAIEIIGLLKSTLRWLASLHEQGAYHHQGVCTFDGSTWSFIEWESKIQNAFEHQFWVPTDAEDDANYNIVHGYVNRRGIYKACLSTYNCVMMYDGLGRTRSGHRRRGATISCAPTCALQ